MGANVTDLFALDDEALRDPDSGRWDAKRISDAMEVDLAKLATAVEGDYPAIAQTPNGEALQVRLAPFANVLAMLHDVFGGDEGRVRIWLRAPQRYFGGKTPLEVRLTPGGATGVEELVVGAWLGEPE